MRSPRIRRTAICLALALLVLAVFLPTVRNGFVNYDDDAYVTRNYQVRQGLSAEGLRWALTTFRQGNWHPLAWLSHMLDVQLFGLDPRGHHLTSLALHLGSTLLLFLTLDSLTGALWPAAAAAALFGVHPLHVESAAWVAERKDVLSVFFGFLAVGAYVRFARAPSRGRHAAVLCLFLLALTAKAMLVTLPLLLLLLDWWPLGRVRAVAGGARWPALLLEKAPLLAASCACGALAIIAQQRGGALAPLDVQPLPERAANAVVAGAHYLLQTAWPAALAVFYPHPGRGIAPATVAASALLLAAITAAALAARRRHPALIVGWLWYLAALLPVSGLVQAGAQASADRYTYLPLAGVFVALAWGCRDAAAGRAPARAVLPVALAAAVVALAASARVQVSYWRDSAALFTRALTVTRGNWLAHNNLAMALDEQGRAGEAIGHYEQALALRPAFPQAHVNLGADLAALGRTAEAREHYLEALRLDPRSPEANNDLGVLLDSLGRTAEAEARYRAALAARPDYPAALNNLGAALVAQGRDAEAVPLYREALRLEPAFAEARQNLGQALARGAGGPGR